MPVPAPDAAGPAAGTLPTHWQTSPALCSCIWGKSHISTGDALRCKEKTKTLTNPSQGSVLHHLQIIFPAGELLSMRKSLQSCECSPEMCG